ncbi:MAG: hypothetical protein ACYC2G_14550 [Gemmatimonadaceae bacterium]
MLTVFDTGEASFRLANRNDEDVGWIHGNVVGFGGLPDEATAIKAAVAGAETLAAYLERTGGPGSAPPRSNGRLKIVSDGAGEWVSRGSSQLARLIRPSADQGEAYAIEFLLPSHLKAGGAIGVSQILHTAISAQLAPVRQTVPAIAEAQAR